MKSGGARWHKIRSKSLIRPPRAAWSSVIDRVPPRDRLSCSWFMSRVTAGRSGTAGRLVQNHGQSAGISARGRLRRFSPKWDSTTPLWHANRRRTIYMNEFDLLGNWARKSPPEGRPGVSRCRGSCDRADQARGERVSSPTFCWFSRFVVAPLSALTILVTWAARPAGDDSWRFPMLRHRHRPRTL